MPPFELTVPSLDEKGLPKRDEEGNIIFLEGHGYEDMKQTCLSGDQAIYEGCPHYKQGEDFKKLWRIKHGIT